MALIDEIIQKTTPALRAAKEHGEIARIVNIDRVKPSTRQIGVGTILETIGLNYGNAMLDSLYVNTSFKYVKPLLEQGRLIAGSPLVVGAIQSMVPVIMPQNVANLLLALTVEPDPVSVQDIINAMKGI